MGFFDNILRNGLPSAVDGIFGISDEKGAAGKPIYQSPAVQYPERNAPVAMDSGVARSVKSEWIAGVDNKIVMVGGALIAFIILKVVK